MSGVEDRSQDCQDGNTGTARLQKWGRGRGKCPESKTINMDVLSG